MIRGESDVNSVSGTHMHDNEFMLLLGVCKCIALNLYANEVDYYV